MRSGITGITHYQAERHPVATFFVLLLLGPYFLAAALLVMAVWVAVAVLCLVTGNGELLRRRR